MAITKITVLSFLIGDGEYKRLSISMNIHRSACIIRRMKTPKLILMIITVIGSLTVAYLAERALAQGKPPLSQSALNTEPLFRLNPSHPVSEPKF